MDKLLNQLISNLRLLTSLNFQNELTVGGTIYEKMELSATKLDLMFYFKV